MGVNRHEEKTNAARSRVAALEKATALNPSLVSGRLVDINIVDHDDTGLVDMLV